MGIFHQHLNGLQFSTVAPNGAATGIGTSVNDHLGKVGMDSFAHGAPAIRTLNGWKVVPVLQGPALNRTLHAGFLDLFGRKPALVPGDQPFQHTPFEQMSLTETALCHLRPLIAGGHQRDFTAGA